MPRSTTRISTSSRTWAGSSVRRADTRTGSPLSEYFSAFSIRLWTADTSCSRSPRTRSVGLISAVSTVNCRWAALDAARPMASLTTRSISITSGSCRLSPSTRLRARTSSTIAVRRWASYSMRPVKRCRVSASVSIDAASASTANAPRGVRSSWLMFETKSRRTRSIRRSSVTSSAMTTDPNRSPLCSTGKARRMKSLRGGPARFSSCSTSSPVAAFFSNSRTAPSRMASPSPVPTVAPGALRNSSAPTASARNICGRIRSTAPTIRRRWRSSAARRASIAEPNRPSMVTACSVVARPNCGPDDPAPDSGVPPKASTCSATAERRASSRDRDRTRATASATAPAAANTRAAALAVDMRLRL